VGMAMNEFIFPRAADKITFENGSRIQMKLNAMLSMIALWGFVSFRFVYVCYEREFNAEKSCKLH
jgi:hypothetical protein